MWYISLLTHLLFHSPLAALFECCFLCAGASIAINGACLTVAGIVENGEELLVEFDVMQVLFFNKKREIIFASAALICCRPYGSRAYTIYLGSYGA
jgi:hypothetical protein